MEFLLLGPLEVRDGESAAKVGGAKQRALLALLLLDLGRVVAAERLIDELWGERAPASARKMVHVHVSNLRKALGADLLRTHAVGYSIEVEAATLDVERFEHLAAEGGRRLRPGSRRCVRAPRQGAVALARAGTGRVQRAVRRA